LKLNIKIPDLKKMSEMIGLDIGSHSIKLVGLNMTPRGPILTHIGIKEIPYGPESEDPAFISETIKALYREIGLKPGKVNLVCWWYRKDYLGCEKNDSGSICTKSINSGVTGVYK